jgi:hypothetical protein
VYQTITVPTLDVTLRYRFDLLQASRPIAATGRTAAVLGVRLSPVSRLDMGSTFDAASLGLEVRAGLVRLTDLTLRPARPLELYAFARGDGRYVVWNAFVQAPLMNGVVPLVTIVPWVWDLNVGLVLRVGYVQLGFGQLWRTQEVTPNPPGAHRVHDIGQITLAWIPW